MKTLPWALAGALFLSSCYTVQHDYTGPREVTPGTKLSQESEALGSVRSKRKASFLFWGLVDLKPGSAPVALEDEAKRTYGEAFDGVTRVRIHEEMDVVDVIVTGLTLGIYSMITVDSEGQVEKFASNGGPQ